MKTLLFALLLISNIACANEMDEKCEKLEKESIEILEDRFDHISEIRLDKDTYYIKITSPKVLADITNIMNGNFDNSEYSWDNYIVSTLLNISKTIKNIAIDYKIDRNYNIVILNPFNEEHILLSVQNGNIIYNFTQFER